MKHTKHTAKRNQAGKAAPTWPARTVTEIRQLMPEVLMALDGGWTLHQVFKALVMTGQLECRETKFTRVCKAEIKRRGWREAVRAQRQLAAAVLYITHTELMGSSYFIEQNRSGSSVVHKPSGVTVGSFPTPGAARKGIAHWVKTATTPRAGNRFYSIRQRTILVRDFKRHFGLRIEKEPMLQRAHEWLLYMADQVAQAVAQTSIHIVDWESATRYFSRAERADARFKAELQEAVAEVLPYCPGLLVEFHSGGIKLISSRAERP